MKDSEVMIYCHENRNNSSLCTIPTCIDLSRKAMDRYMRDIVFPFPSMQTVNLNHLCRRRNQQVYLHIYSREGNENVTKVYHFQNNIFNTNGASYLMAVCRITTFGCPNES